MWSPEDKELRHRHGPWIEYTKYSIEEEVEERERHKLYLAKMALARDAKEQRKKERAYVVFNKIKGLGLTKDQFYGAISWMKENPKDFLFVEEEKTDDK
jgi:hypothetical protein